MNHNPVTIKDASCQQMNNFNQVHSIDAVEMTEDPLLLHIYSDIQSAEPWLLSQNC